MTSVMRRVWESHNISQSIYLWIEMRRMSWRVHDVSSYSQKRESNERNNRLNFAVTVLHARKYFIACTICFNARRASSIHCTRENFHVGRKSFNRDSTDHAHSHNINLNITNASLAFSQSTFSSWTKRNKQTANFRILAKWILHRIFLSAKIFLVIFFQAPEHFLCNRNNKIKVYNGWQCKQEKYSHPVQPRL